MSKIRNWSKLEEDSIVYRETFLNSPYDRNVKPVVWEFDGFEDLLYVLYKADDGSYHTENFGEDVEKLDNLLPDIGSDIKLRQKNRARNMATDVLESNPEPFSSESPENMDMKERSKYWFENLYEILYVPEDSPQVSTGYKLTSLQNRSSKYAHINSYGFTVNKLGIDWSHWERSNDEERLRILLHELTHLRHSHHKEDFWRDLANHTNRAYRNRDKFVTEFDWRKIARKTVKDVNRSNLDLRVSNVNDMRRNMENWLNFNVQIDDNYSSDRMENLWDKVRGIKSSSYGQFGLRYSGSDSFGMNDDYVWDEEFSDEELWNFFSDIREPNTSVTPQKGEWVIGKVNVEDEGFEERDRSVNSETVERTYTPCSREDAMKLAIAEKMGSTLEVRQKC